MSRALLAAPLPFDVEVGSLLVANMLSAWLDNEVVGKATEAAHESSQNHRASPQPVRLCLPPAINSRQVLHHQESTERQYALRGKAQELGWSEASIRTLDGDLGKSGAPMTRREDFKTLVADVSMGQVGAVFALEASRLSRSDLDWHR